MDTALYLHIPFCKTKCDYCDFFSVACGNSRVPDAYVDSLCNEIKVRASEENIDSFTTVYAGGGTPSLLTAPQIKKIFSVILSISKEKPSEITFELNPDDVNSSLLKVLSESGVTRISVGIQSFEDKTLKRVKRRSDLKTVYSCLEIIKKEWKGVFSADVIAALPGQTCAQFMEGLKKLVACSPDHISMYSLSIEEETPLGKEFFSGKLEYDSDAADRMWIEGRDFLEKSGYPQYEVSNFAPEKKRCRHNLVYWHLQDYLGCGSGGTGSLYGKRLRYTNTSDIKNYIDFWSSSSTQDKAPEQRELLSEKTVEFEFFMMGLRLLDGISERDYERRFGKKIPEKITALFEAWIQQGRAWKKYSGEDVCYGLNKKGILFLNAFLENMLD